MHLPRSRPSIHLITILHGSRACLCLDRRQHRACRPIPTMSTRRAPSAYGHANLAATAEAVKEASAWVYPLRQRSQPGHCRPEISHRPAAHRADRERPRPARRCAGPGQDAGVAHPGRGGAGPLPAHPVHARHAAGRHCRHADLQSARRHVQSQARPDLQPTLSSPTKSTAHRPRCRARCSRQCRNVRSRWAKTPTSCPSRSSSWPRRIPVEQEGTYPLPEAQVDRFMLKIVVTYPSRAEERGILDAMATTTPNARRAAGGDARTTFCRRKQVINTIPRRRQGARLHRRRGHRHARTEGRTSSIFRAGSSTGASPRATISLTLRGARPRLPQRPRLRHAAGRQGCRARRSAASRHRHLRGRGGESLVARYRAEDFGHPPGALKGRR